jgi:type II restriction/modification system DNA methylase subunit YeeA
MDAILAYDEEGRPVGPAWPEANVIIGNPPFLGGKFLRRELNDAYVDDLYELYVDRIPRDADLVTYWFERTMEQIASGQLSRAGLLATQGIRGGVNRRVLQRVKDAGDIYMAWSDRPWILDGAAVHISMIGFDNGKEHTRTLNGLPVESINSDLTSIVDLTNAHPLLENRHLCFQGPVKVGAFDILPEIAYDMLAAVGNPNGRPNSDVLRPWVNGLDTTRRPRGMWIIDFGEFSISEAALYEAPFEYVRHHVEPERRQNSDRQRRENWWRLGRSGTDVKSATAKIERYIGTPRVAKHRLFIWLASRTLPDTQVVAIAREDDYFFGVLHSWTHELWARATGTQLREAESGFRYTPTTTFETFPFPWPPGQEPEGDARVEAIAEAARAMVALRDRWLNPEGATEAELTKRTLTNLYNARPAWLDMAHRRLDDAVLDAYGWSHDLSDEEILERLLMLNLERTAK